MPIFEDRCSYSSSSPVFIPVNVQKSLERLDENKTMGFDAKILCKCWAAFSLPLTYIFEISMETSGVPDSCKKANLTSIFKKGAKVKTSNYRPVAWTSVPGKITERIERDEIMNHCV